MNAPPLLSIRGVSKRFGGTQALADVSLDVTRGEVRAIVGENGAGKSTLMKILTGVEQADDGQISWDGRPVDIRTPLEARRLGIAIVHQELSLVPNLSVAENVFVGHTPARQVSGLSFVDRPAMLEQTRALLADFDVPIDPSTRVRDLSLAVQQVVEIAKALSQHCRLLILDEPTSALTAHEVEMLFSLLERLRASDMTIVYISHKLDEVLRLADSCTVLRDGSVVATLTRAEMNSDRLVSMMVGRTLGTLYPPHGGGGQPLLEVKGLRRGNRVQDVSFTLRSGEILGVAGLVGAGRTEMARAIFGADARDGGDVLLAGRPLDVRTPSDAIRQGVGYVPEDRKDLGLFLRMGVRENVIAVTQSDSGLMGRRHRGAEYAAARDAVRDFRIRTPGIDTPLQDLSGGNQQKVLLAKWLAIKPRVLIVDEPTRGIDVGAKVEIHRLLGRLAESGVGVLLISSDLPEVLGMSDRILVMRNGRTVAELDGATATENLVMTAAVGTAA
jgi:ABC-type sugar transport system ATPase subunit